MNELGQWRLWQMERELMPCLSDEVVIYCLHVEKQTQYGWILQLLRRYQHFIILNFKCCN